MSAVASVFVRVESATALQQQLIVTGLIIRHEVDMEESILPSKAPGPRVYPTLRLLIAIDSHANAFEGREGGAGDHVSQEGGEPRGRSTAKHQKQERGLICAHTVKGAVEVV